MGGQIGRVPLFVILSNECMLTQQDFDRFQAKIAFSDECWLWTASKTHAGYGRFRLPMRTISAHRVSYEWFKGPIPIDKQIDHLCRVRLCVNPEHLELVTNQVNVLRGLGPTAQFARRAHCDWGHPFDDTNTLWRVDEGRRCKECLLQKGKRQWAKHKERRSAKK